MPNRILKESICSSDTLDGLTEFQEIFFYRLIVNVDDYGRLDARARILSSKLFPLKTIKEKTIEDALHALYAADLICLYEVNGRPYLQMKTWDKHQQIRAKKSKYPSMDEGIRLNLISNDINCNQMISDDIKCSRNPIQSESNPNPNPIREVCANAPLPTTRRFTPPTVEEVASYAREKGYRIDPARFVDFYASKGWKVGSSPMKDWKAAVRNWAGRDRYEPAPQQLPCPDPPRQTYPDVPYDDLPDNIRKIVRRDEWA